MLHTGLLWFDDDTKRPLAEKVADAVARYNERIGGAPTVCQLNPASAVLLAEQQHKQRQQARERNGSAGRRAAKRTAGPRGVRLPRLIPDPSLPVHYFFVGRDEPDDVVQAAPATPPVAEAEAEVVESAAPAAPHAGRATPRRRFTGRTVVPPTHAAPMADPTNATPPAATASALAPASPAPKHVRTEHPRRVKRARRQEGLPEPTPVATQAAAPQPAAPRAKTAVRARDGRSLVELPAQQPEPTTARNRAAETPTARSRPASSRSRTAKRSTPPVMQPPLPLLADHATSAPRHPRRRAS